MQFDHVTRRRDASGQSQVDSPVGRPSGQYSSVFIVCNSSHHTDYVETHVV